MKALAVLLGVLGEFLKLSIDELKDKKVADKLAKRAREHAKFLADEDMSESDKRNRLWNYIVQDGKQLGEEIKENFARQIAELAWKAAKKEMADQIAKGIGA
jgi:hypothetical protein